MSRPRYLADHDFNERILHGVWQRDAAIEIVRARERGLEEKADPDILAFAAAEGLIVLSHDVNTMPAAAYARLAAGQTMTGLFMVPQRYPLGPMIDDLVLICATSEAEEWGGQVVFLPL
jgi:hypothetical protein